MPSLQHQQQKLQAEISREHREEEIIRILLEDPQHTIELLNTEILGLDTTYLIHWIVYYGWTTLLETPFQSPTQTERFPLHRFIRNNTYKVQDRVGKTCLHELAATQEVIEGLEKLTALLEHIFKERKLLDVANQPDKYNRTPLYDAATTYNYDACSILLDRFDTELNKPCGAPPKTAFQHLVEHASTQFSGQVLTHEHPAMRLILRFARRADLTGIDKDFVETIAHPQIRTVVAAISIVRANPAEELGALGRLFGHSLQPQRMISNNEWSDDDDDERHQKEYQVTSELGKSQFTHEVFSTTESCLQLMEPETSAPLDIPPTIGESTPPSSVGSSPTSKSSSQNLTPTGAKLVRSSTTSSTGSDPETPIFPTDIAAERKQIIEAINTNNESAAIQILRTSRHKRQLLNEPLPDNMSQTYLIHWITYYAWKELLQEFKCYIKTYDAKDKDDWNCLHELAVSEHITKDFVELLTNILKAQGILTIVNDYNKNGHTPLYLAANHGLRINCSVLLDKCEAELNTRNGLKAEEAKTAFEIVALHTCSQGNLIPQDNQQMRLLLKFSKRSDLLIPNSLLQELEKCNPQVHTTVMAIKRCRDNPELKRSLGEKIINSPPKHHRTSSETLDLPLPTTTTKHMHTAKKTLSFEGATLAATS